MKKDVIILVIKMFTMACAGGSAREIQSGSDCGHPPRHGCCRTQGKSCQWNLLFKYKTIISFNMLKLKPSWVGHPPRNGCCRTQGKSCQSNLYFKAWVLTKCSVNLTLRILTTMYFNYWCNIFAHWEWYFALCIFSEALDLKIRCC